MKILSVPDLEDLRMFESLFDVFLISNDALKGLYAPEIWVPDPYGLTGKVQTVNPAWDVEVFDPFVLRGITYHDIIVGTLGIFAGLFHFSIRPPQLLYKGLRMGSIEFVLSSGIFAIFLQLLLLPELCDDDGIVRANVPFRKAKSNYSVEKVGVTVEFYDNELSGISYSNPTTIQKYARRAQLGEIFELDRATLKFDGVS
ncbi:Photosystem II CP47 reaction center protein [Capsicum baccatum]|uniref:Photosystem II CP47 reaction center protein n=1 Tax=Capsicum baccatum TaxID=33114 RepID=A0A2G2WIM3_CAPBA|nr:Photosystem II CP47 reaction center protein [Capsicum baccatum]